ncbi:adenosine deaminases [Zea mays]|uniref:Adenosine deaminases n=1 Tax=Zea mays TaxID=4577 RepID=A0A1D6J5G3_MAIZE|nr:adenosine deaminases [Zea mays]
MSCFDKITRWSVVGIQVVTKCPSGINPLSVHSSTGALLSHILEPLYLSTITIGQLPDGTPERFSIKNNIKKALDARLSSLPTELPPPFKMQKVGVPFLMFQYSICWNKSGLHEVVLGTTGRKQGTSSKAAHLPSTESLLCKKRLLEAFVSLEHPLVGQLKCEELSYRALKDTAHEYHHALELLRKAPFFGCWRAKPTFVDSFAVSR